jgi:hypothetical protein
MNREASSAGNFFWIAIFPIWTFQGKKNSSQNFHSPHRTKLFHLKKFLGERESRWQKSSSTRKEVGVVCFETQFQLIKADKNHRRRLYIESNSILSLPPRALLPRTFPEQVKFFLTQFIDQKSLAHHPQPLFNPDVLFMPKNNGKIPS